MGLKDGTFSYFDFYTRRARRLFPALIVVLMAAWSIGWFTLLPTDYASLGQHMIGGAAFWANVQTYFESGYFDALTTNKPLLHLWSLGVEEQFYIVFPALLVLLWRHGNATRVLAAIGAVSFFLNIVTFENHSSFSFYLPIPRFWEFIAGGLIARLPYIDFKSTIPARLLWIVPIRFDLIASLGMAASICGIAFANEDAFPGWWATLPVIGAACLIAAGPKAWINRTLLANRALVFVGLISYPLYLWHWPLLVLGHAMMRNGYRNSYERATTLVAIGLSFVLAWLTYKFVERPARKSRSIKSTRQLSVLYVALLSMVAFLGFTTIKSNGFLSRYPPELLNLLTPLTLGSDYPPSNESNNNKGSLVVTYGDSHAWHLVPGLRLLQKERSFRLDSINWYPCSPLIDLKPELDDTCREMRARDDAMLKQLKPDIVLIGVLWLDNPHIERLTERIKFLQQIGVRSVIVIGSVPRWRDSGQLEIYDSYRSDPLHRIPERSLDFAKGMIETDERVKQIAIAAGAKFVSAYDVLCDDVDGCLLRLGDSARDIVQVDRTHFSAEGSYYLIRHIEKQIFNYDN